MFLKGVKPMFEDPANEPGGEYQIRLASNIKEDTFDYLNAIWSSLVQDVITKRFPNSNQLLGVRVVDKSFSGKQNFRIEIWVRYNTEKAEEAPAIKRFLEEEYYQKYSDQQGIAFKLHKF
jgi:hypothetical protein